jgi:hypothetical protein
MGHFAKLNENNEVIEVHSVLNSVFEINGISNENKGVELLSAIFNHSYWKQTSYNTRGGIHYQNDNNTPSIDQSKAFRKNFAKIGYRYDEQRDAFIEAKPFPSWVLNEFSCMYNPPIKYPDKTNIPDFYKRYNNYKWDEDIVDWKLIKLFNSWTLSTNNYYISPIPYPNDGLRYIWDENLINWVLLINNG